MILRPIDISNRFTAALLGGYFFTWGVVSFGMVTLTMIGVDFHHAEITMLLLAFLIYLVVFVLAFYYKSLLKIWLVFVFGGGLMMLIAWLSQSWILG